MFFDAVRVKVRNEGFVRNKTIYIALGVLPDGTKEILGIWIEQTEGAKFWLRVVNELMTRGEHDILIAVADGLKGFPEAINAVFPQTVIQTCIVGPLKKSSFFPPSFFSWPQRAAPLVFGHRRVHVGIHESQLRSHGLFRRCKEPGPPSETMAMGDLSGWSKQPDRVFIDPV